MFGEDPAQRNELDAESAPAVESVNIQLSHAFVGGQEGKASASEFAGDFLIGWDSSSEPGEAIPTPLK